MSNIDYNPYDDVPSSRTTLNLNNNLNNNVINTWNTVNSRTLSTGSVYEDLAFGKGSLNAPLNLNLGQVDYTATSSAPILQDLRLLNRNAAPLKDIRPVLRDLALLVRKDRDNIVTSNVSSSTENVILNSRNPIEIRTNETVNVNGEQGLLLNSDEIANFTGPISINQYEINQDSNPLIIRKRPDQVVNYVQDVNIRYLRPPTPPPPGDIVIQQLPDRVLPPAPPVVIRQEPPKPTTPPPLVVREVPPSPPPEVPAKTIAIPGKILPPPARKVVVEKLPEIPPKPQSVFVDRWLPYDKLRRKVIFQEPPIRDPVIINPKNLIVQWQQPDVVIGKEILQHGVYRVDPREYVAKYGPELRAPPELPPIAANVPPPPGAGPLAAQVDNEYVYELEGEVGALNLIDLDKVGLGRYKTVVQKYARAPSPVIQSVKYVENVPEVRYVEEAPKVRYVQNAPQVRYVEKAPQVRYIENAPQVRYIENAPQVRYIENAPQVRYVENAPQVRYIENAPRYRQEIPSGQFIRPPAPPQQASAFYVNPMRYPPPPYVTNLESTRFVRQVPASNIFAKMDLPSATYTRSGPPSGQYVRQAPTSGSIIRMAAPQQQQQQQQQEQLPAAREFGPTRWVQELETGQWRRA